MKAKRVYIYVIENWQDGVVSGESVVGVYFDVKNAKDELMKHYSAQKKIEGDACKTVFYFDSEHKERNELPPMAGYWKFDDPILMVDTETSGGVFVGTGRTIRAIFEKAISD